MCDTPLIMCSIEFSVQTQCISFLLCVVRLLSNLPLIIRKSLYGEHNGKHHLSLHTKAGRKRMNAGSMIKKMSTHLYGWSFQYTDQVLQSHYQAQSYIGFGWFFN